MWASKCSRDRAEFKLWAPSDWFDGDIWSWTLTTKTSLGANLHELRETKHLLSCTCLFTGRSPSCSLHSTLPVSSVVGMSWSRGRSLSCGSRWCCGRSRSLYLGEYTSGPSSCASLTLLRNQCRQQFISALAVIIDLSNLVSCLIYWAMPIVKVFEYNEWMNILPMWNYKENIGNCEEIIECVESKKHTLLFFNSSVPLENNL